MHQLIFGHDEVVANFVASLIPECRERGFGKCRAIGIASHDGYLLGGLVYRNWCPEVGTIEISGAAVPGTNWLSRRVVQVMYDYPFYVCGCQMVIKTTMADNEIVLRIMAAIGFTLHYVKRLGGRDRDGVVGTLTLEDWEASRYNINRKKVPDVQPASERAARRHHAGADERSEPAALLAGAAATDAATAADAGAQRARPAGARRASRRARRAGANGRANGRADVGASYADAAATAATAATAAGVLSHVQT